MFSILQREIGRVPRQKKFLRSRMVISIGAFLFSLLLLSDADATGAGMFATTTFFAFWFCLLLGVRRAAGSISEEKREGTLGLYFLTPLRPREIILGKAASIAVPMIQPLFACIPAIAIALLAGGVVPAELLRAALAMPIILAFSISIGMLVSTHSRKPNSTGLSTLFLILAIVVLPLIVGHGPIFWFRAFSPYTAYALVTTPGYAVSADLYWFSLLALAAMSAAALAGAIYYLPRRWQEEPFQTSRPAKTRDKAKASAVRAQILDRNPGEWLAARHAMGRFERVAFWTIIGIALLVIAVTSRDLGFGPVMAIDFCVVFYVLIRMASQASFPLINARESGAMEILSVSPLPPKMLVRGQIRSLLFQFGPPLAVLFAASVLALVFQRDSGVVFATSGFMGILLFWTSWTITICAVALFGIWRGLVDKSANIAFFKTILFAGILPWMCMPFFGLPIGPLIVGLIAIHYITGHRLHRLIRGEK
jgi:ABC-type transport system involved in cytochrome c biogenesis permease component